VQSGCQRIFPAQCADFSLQISRILLVISINKKSIFALIVSKDSHNAVFTCFKQVNLISPLLPESASEMRILLNTWVLTPTVSLTRKVYDDSENLGGLSFLSSTVISRRILTMLGSAVGPFSSSRNLKMKNILFSYCIQSPHNKDQPIITC
jgi:hypothetical protein